MTEKLDKEVIKARITAARKARGLQQNELANLAGVTPASISQMENGLRMPSVPVLARLASVLQVSFEYLTGQTDEQQTQEQRATQLFRDLQALPEDTQKMIQAQIDAIKKIQGGNK
ncbi:MAG: helix-turn-helix transcriptional regulator [Bdellovibrionales bacterium]|nr:helix-turn-helix transcriptional regulator [Bdellovibrionales bacterium]